MARVQRSARPPRDQRKEVSALEGVELLTSDAVLLNARPIGLPLRAAGVIIDATLYTVLYLLMVFLVLRKLTEEFTSGDNFDHFLAITVILLTVFQYLILPLTIETVTRGRSLGKLICGTRVVRVDGASITWRHAFVRSVAGVFETYLASGAVAAVVCLMSSKGQRLGDMMAGTIVIQDRYQPATPVDATLSPSLEAWAHAVDIRRPPAALAARLRSLFGRSRSLNPQSWEDIADTLLGQLSEYVTPMPPRSVPVPVQVESILAVMQSRERHIATARHQRAQVFSSRVAALPWQHEQNRPQTHQLAAHQPAPSEPATLSAPTPRTSTSEGGNA